MPAKPAKKRSSMSQSAGPTRPGTATDTGDSTGVAEQLIKPLADSSKTVALLSAIVRAIPKKWRSWVIGTFVVSVLSFYGLAKTHPNIFPDWVLDGMTIGPERVLGKTELLRFVPKDWFDHIGQPDWSYPQLDPNNPNKSKWSLFNSELLGEDAGGIVDVGGIAALKIDENYPADTFHHFYAAFTFEIQQNTDTVSWVFRFRPNVFDGQPTWSGYLFQVTNLKRLKPRMAFYKCIDGTCAVIDPPQEFCSTENIESLSKLTIEAKEGEDEAGLFRVWGHFIGIDKRDDDKRDQGFQFSKDARLQFRDSKPNPFQWGNIAFLSLSGLGNDGKAHKVQLGGAPFRLIKNVLVLHAQPTPPKLEN